MKALTIILTLFFLGNFYAANCQEKEIQQDSLTHHYKRNIIKWNVTPMVWSIRNVNIAYEHVLSNYSSFSLNGGFFVLPEIGLVDSLDLIKTNKKWGFSISGDKRYYIKSRNLSTAPDGLYWGIFGSLHYYEFENYVNVVNSNIAHGDLLLNGNLNIVTAGVELGYQYIFKNNISVDLVIIGPAISMYSTKLSIRGDLEIDKESEYTQALYDIIVARFPGANILFKEKSLNDDGTTFSIGPGFRYMIQVGYRF